MGKTVKKSLAIVLMFVLPIFLLSVIMDIMKVSGSIQDCVLDLSMIVSVLVVLIYLKFQGITFRSNKPVHKIDLKLLGIILLLRISWSMFGQQLAFVTLPYTPYEETTMNLMSALSAIILSPITEEITFRYGIINIGKKYEKSVLAIFMSVILFVVVHFPNLPVAVCMIGSAFLYAFVYFKTGNLLYSVIAHSVSNFFSVMTYYIPQMERMYFVDSANKLINPYFIVSFIIFIFCVVLIFNYNYANIDKNTK